MSDDEAPEGNDEGDDVAVDADIEIENKKWCAVCDEDTVHDDDGCKVCAEITAKIQASGPKAALFHTIEGEWDLTKEPTARLAHMRLLDRIALALDDIAEG